jgi:hypothetical protein
MPFQSDRFAQRCYGWESPHKKLIAAAIACLLLLTGCSTVSVAELNKIGSEIVPAKIDFSDLYVYAQRSGAAYQNDSTIRARYPLTVRIQSPLGSSVKYFVERDDKQHQQFITIRGTDNNKNLSEDLNITVRDDRKIAIPVHSGFDQAARAIYNDVTPYLKPEYKTYVTGHSLGGAVAALLAVYLMEDGVQVARVVTFGQPRFTTRDGVKRLGLLPLTRVVDEYDVVPMIPPGIVADSKFGPYEQIGPEVILLEGPDFVYLPSHDATRIAIGELWRTLSYADVKDHQIAKYLKRIAEKTKVATQVPYNEREKLSVLDSTLVHW